jgi:ribosome biogenesis protein BMS1
VLGVLTHLDKFKSAKTLKSTKKKLKSRFWTEIYQGAKLFYLSGILHGKYLKREIFNLSRYISLQKFRPLSWRTSHPYVLVDRVDDITDPERMRQNPKCDRNVLFFGYVRGTNLKASMKVHIPGGGDFLIKSVKELPDPCPRPEKTQRQRIGEKDKLIFAPMADIGNIEYDADAMWIKMPQSQVLFSDVDTLDGSARALSAAAQLYSAAPGEMAPGERMVRELQRTDYTLDDALANQSLRLLSTSKPTLTSSASHGDNNTNNADEGDDEDIDEDGDDDDEDEEDDADFDDADDELKELDDAAYYDDDDAQDDVEKQPDTRTRRPATEGSIAGLRSPGGGAVNSKIDGDMEFEDDEDDDDDEKMDIPSDEDVGDSEEHEDDGDDDEDDDNDGMDVDDDEDDVEAGEGRWKENLAQRALERFYRPLNLMRIVYGDKLDTSVSQRATHTSSDRNSSALLRLDDYDEKSFVVSYFNYSFPSLHPYLTTSLVFRVSFQGKQPDDDDDDELFKVKKPSKGAIQTEMETGVPNTDSNNQVESCKVVAESQELLESLEETTTLAEALRSRFVPKDPTGMPAEETDERTKASQRDAMDVFNDAPLYGDFEDLEATGGESGNNGEEDDDDGDDDDEDRVQIMNADATRAALAEKKLQLKAQFDAAYDDKKDTKGSSDAEEEDGDDAHGYGVGQSM